MAAKAERSGNRWGIELSILAISRGKRLRSRGRPGGPQHSKMYYVMHGDVDFASYIFLRNGR